MNNFVVFLVKTALLFVVFWLLDKLFSSMELENPIPTWGMCLILAAVASGLDWIVDSLVKPGSQIAGYTQFRNRNLV